MPGIYIHIPFCVKKCAYCDFPSFKEPNRISEYLGALRAEAKRCGSLASGRVFDSVFIGGGTPSLMPPGAAAKLLDEIRRCFALDANAEITIECNPGTVDAEKAAEYAAAGINRVSVGLQSADGALLKRIGRIHTFEQFTGAFYALRGAGMENINVDVMYGLPAQEIWQFLDTLKQVCIMGPEHISAYSLILEKHTPLYDAVNNFTEALPDEDAVFAMQDAGYAFLEHEGYLRYEISNFALPGRACRHNLNYWQNGEYLGLGLGAHSAMRVAGQWTRWENAATLEAYFGQGAPLRVNAVERKEEMFECVMLGLRMVEGINLKAFEQRFGMPITLIYGKAVERLAKKGWLVISGGCMRLTRQGLDMENSALMEFMD